MQCVMARCRKDLGAESVVVCVGCEGGGRVEITGRWRQWCPTSNFIHATRWASCEAAIQSFGADSVGSPSPTELGQYPVVEGVCC